MYYSFMCAYLAIDQTFKSAFFFLVLYLELEPNFPILSACVRSKSVVLSVLTKIKYRIEFII